MSELESVSYTTGVEKSTLMPTDTVPNQQPPCHVRFAQMSDMKKSQYEPLLNEDLVRLRCKPSIKKLPLPTTHLQEQWDNLETSPPLFDLTSPFAGFSNRPGQLI